MELDQATRERIEAIIKSDKVVLFMKGTRQMPQCGFSAATIGALDSLTPQYTTFNVLEDQEVREGIKAFSSWPTIPQLYINEEFVGGCDIVKQMFNAGELHKSLGLDEPDRTAPEISISDTAANTFREALASNPDQAVHLSIDGSWQHNFSLGPSDGHEIKSSANGIDLLMDIGTAQKAKGLVIDMTESVQGRSFSVSNPNIPSA